MMKKLILPILITAVATLSFGFTASQTTVTHSAITFAIKNLGINTGGTIGGLIANVKLDPANLASSTIEASVDVNTINTDNTLRDDHLKTDEFFDAAHYPKITLKSVSLKHKSGNNYSGKFNLTIKNKTKLIDVPFTCTDKGNAIVFSGSFKLNRLDFGVGESSFTLSDEVTVTVNAEMEK